MKDFIQRLLGRRWLPLLLVGLALALAAPALWTGWQQDDLIHRYFLLGNVDYAGERPSPLDLFYFLDGDSARARGLMDIGVVPWWTLPDLRLSFLRPMASLTHWVDYQLWPDIGLLMHLQSLLWFAAVVVVAALLYRRLLGMTWVAGLAALFFALDDIHGLPAGWLANRNALLSLFFGLMTLLVHDRWRQDGWLPGAFLGPAFLLLGLLSGESSLAVLGYLVAYGLFLDRGSAGERVRSVVPHMALAFLWVLLYRSLGYGTRGSGFYVDVLSEPVLFLKAVAWKAPLLLADLWGLPPSSFIVFVDDTIITWLVVWAIILLLLVGSVLWPLARRDHLARFWLLGMMLSIPFACLTMPHSRLLGFACLGGMGLLAQWVGGLLVPAAWVPGGRLWRFAAYTMMGFFVLVHLLIAPLMLSVNATSASFAERYVQTPISEVKFGPELAGQDLVIVNHPLVYYAHFFSTVRILEGQPAPRSVRVLAPSAGGLSIRRADESSLILRPEGGFLQSPFDRLFRGSDYSLKLGEEVRLARTRATITRITQDGRPAEVFFRFSVPLEDPSLKWLHWHDGHYVLFRPPALGESVVLKGGPLQ